MWYMKPVTVSTTVPESLEDVYAFLDVMANHEQFNDHMLTAWELSGPPTGVGARAHVTSVMGGRSEAVDIEVIDAEAPVRISERNVGAGGRRVAHGTYRLAPASGGGTSITFDYSWESAPLAERLAAPLARAVLARGLRTSMDRLRDQLAAAPVSAPTAG
jgi:hypothetical protein